MAVTTFRAQYAFLSNFAPCFGTTVEHLFQAAKTDNPKEVARVMAARTPAEAKRLGSGVTLRLDWTQVREHVMLGLLRRKFAPGSELATQLLATGDEELVEGNTGHDQTWGCCDCSRHKGTGRNLLGKLLMQVRQELRMVDAGPTITVGNTYSGAQGINIMRPSVLGNPFHIGAPHPDTGKPTTRDDVVDAYLPELRRLYAQKGAAYAELVRIAVLVRSGQRVTLVCCCAPKRCHGDVIKDAIEKIIARG